MLLEIRDHVGTDRNNRQVLSFREVQGRFGEKGGNAMVLLSRRHFRVVEAQPAGSVVVVLEHRDAFRKADFEAVRRDIVLDRRVCLVQREEAARHQSVGRETSTTTCLTSSPIPRP